MVFADKPLLGEIEKRKTWMVDEEKRLEVLARKQAEKSCQCPKCGGTGVTKVVETCSICEGKGALTLKVDEVKKHFRQAGISMLSDAVWDFNFGKVFDLALMRLSGDHDVALKTLEERLRGEAL